MAYRISLECGDSSCLRAKKTQEGYTHDWEVFVRGEDNAPIHHYIEKVVFHLHSTFQKPKRVIKEPPYIVKESGYAGFDIPIDIFFKNKNEPKRFHIVYNLYLGQRGQAVNHTTHHSHIFTSEISDEFRKKLLKGGATPISNVESVPEKNEVKTIPMVGKPKLSGNDNRKHRIPEQKLTNSFMDIFGDPVKKLPVEKKPIEKLVSSKTTLPVPEKSEKIDKSTKPKHSPHKDSKKDKSSDEKKDKRDKEKEVVKDKDKIKEKSKRSSSPTSNKISHHSSDSKRSSSPMLMKKPITPPPVPKRPSSPSSKPKEKERKPTEPEKEKDRSKESSKSTSDESKGDKGEKESKSERKKDKKKHKEDRDKEKKEKHKDKEREKSRDKESMKSTEKKVDKIEKPEKDKLLEVKHLKEERKSPKPIKEVEKIKEEKVPKLEKSEKHKESKSEKSDKSKHKHKKRDKKDKRDGSRERDKKEKREKSKGSTEKHDEVISHTSILHITTAPVRVSETQSRDSSYSGSEDEEPISKNRTPNLVKTPSVSPSPPPEPLYIRSMSPPPPPVSDVKRDKSEKKREKSKSSREEKEKKKKRKSESKGLDDEISPKKIKSERDYSTSPLVEPVSSSQSPIAANLDALHSKMKHEPAGMAMDTEPEMGDCEQVAPDSTNSTLVDTDEPVTFSEDYVSQLKDLQQKIMTLQDNQELQRVVQVIAETGQYEITKKTFDFDLCALDRRTVARLQQFFAS